MNNSDALSLDGLVGGTQFVAPVVNVSGHLPVETDPLNFRMVSEFLLQTVVRPHGRSFTTLQLNITTINSACQHQKAINLLKK